MKFKFVSGLFLGCIVCFLVLFSSSTITARDSENAKKIGFVNLKHIFRDYKKVKAMEQQISRETEMELSKIKGIEEQVKQLREEIPLYKPGTPIRKRKEKELTEKLFTIKYKKDRAEYFFKGKMKASIEKVYREITAAIKEYAKKHRFFMIIRVSDADFFGTHSEDALRLEINTRDVLYWGKNYDITNYIISTMNKQYLSKRQNKRN